MNYTECEVRCELKRKETPLISNVPIDEFTKMVSDCFDYDFNGESSFFPFEFPKELLDLPFEIMVITGGLARERAIY